MYLKIHSPHLSYFIEKEFSMIPSSIEESFKYAMDRDGGLELDYQRVEGQSYNPRPARVALIGIKDANIRDEKSIQLLILSCLLEKGNFTNSTSAEEITQTFPNLDKNSIENIVQLCELSKLSEESFLNPDMSIYLCLYIDRMRHAHLSG